LSKDWRCGDSQGLTNCDSLLDFCDCNSFHTDSWNKLE
jgi:hypothetical protein